MTIVAGGVAALIALGVLGRVAAGQSGLAGPMLGFHYGVPLKWSATLAFPLPFGAQTLKPFVAGEPGIGGWRASAGYLLTKGNLGSGYVLRASMLRTGKRAWMAPAGGSFVGLEFQYMPLFALGARVGGFMRTNTRTSKNGLFTLDFSLML